MTVAVAMTLAACATAGGEATAEAMRAYPAASAEIRVMGRHAVQDGAVAFGAAGVTFQVRFRGTALEAELEDEFRDGTGYNWFTVVVDGGPPARFRTEPGRRRYPLAAGLAPGEHTVLLSKATEGQNGRNRLVALHAAGELLPAPPLPERRIEFIGNSVTAGFGLDPRPVACGAGTWFDATHAWLAYGPLMSRRLNAQWMLSAVSGIGMLRNWDSPGPTMPGAWGGVFMEYADADGGWDFGRYTPDLVVVALGTNDFSDGPGPEPRPAPDAGAFVQAYTAFVAGVRERYPRARLLLVSSPMLEPERNARLESLLQRVVERRAAAGDRALSRFSFAGRYVAGCDGHPGLDEHARMAGELEAEVRRVMGWRD